MKDARTFLDKLQQFEQLPEEVVQDILSSTRKEVLPKRSILLRPGQICENFYFIEKGLARLFYVNEGKEYTTDIFIDGEFMVEFASFTFRNPSMQSIEMLEDSTVYSMSYENLQRLYSKYPIMERIGRLVAEHHYRSLSAHTYLLKFSTTAERYEHLFENKIEIIRRAPLGVIASYLGMSIENLSRIRRKVDG